MAAAVDSKVSNPEVAAGWLNTGRTHANGSADVMFVIHRSSNENLVCYKGVVQDKRCYDSNISNSLNYQKKFHRVG